MGTQVGLINLAFTLNLKVPAAREESGDGVVRPGPAQHVIDPTLRRELPAKVGEWLQTITSARRMTKKPNLRPSSRFRPVFGRASELATL
jgi:hypothetical protein